jgi:hypothetical protein
LLQQINEKLNADLKALDENDHLESQAKHPTAAELKAKIEQVRSRQGQDQQLLETRQAREELQLSLTDTDSRAMKTRQGIDVCYHVQMAVDAKPKLIVAHEVTKAVTDQDQLATMAKQAQEVFGTDHFEVVTDVGYYAGDEVKKCLEDGIVPYISKPQTSATSKLGLFGKEEFIYNPEKDCYRGPAGQEFTFRFETVAKDRHSRYYSTSAGRACPLKPNCPRNKENRRITRWVPEGLLEARQQRVTANPAKVRLRKSMVEHPFGTIQRGLDQGYVLTRGRAKGRAEMRLTVLTYNLKSVITILGVKHLIAAGR